MSTKSINFQELISSGKRLTQSQRIKQVLSEAGPLTRNELAERTGMRLSSVCGRVNELISAGSAVSVGARRCQITDKTCELVSSHD